MKTRIFAIASLSALAAGLASAATYTNFIRQIQTNTGVQYDMSVGQSGTQLSPLSINPGGATFQLWTVQTSPLTSTLLASQFVGSYIPQATVTITSEDPYATIPRTRCDRPFTVNVAVGGLLTGWAGAPVPATEVQFNRYTQSYGTGTGVGIDRTQATLYSQAYITSNGTQTLTYSLTVIPGANRAKVRGEETFSVYSLADYQTPQAIIDSHYIQLWPVADATIAGMTDGQAFRFTLPTLTITLNDLYPNSKTYAQAYQGSPRLGATGNIVGGSAVNIADSVPNSRVLTVSNWDAAAPKNGLWTIEVLTTTPFGTDRLAYLTFNIDRSITVRSGITTMD